MHQFASAVASILAQSIPGLLGGSGLLGMLTFLFRQRTERDRAATTRCENFETAYFKIDAFARNILQVAAPIAVAWGNGHPDRALNLMEFLAPMICQQDDKGVWSAKPMPDFLLEARNQNDTMDGRKVG